MSRRIFSDQTMKQKTLNKDAHKLEKKIAANVAGILEA